MCIRDSLLESDLLELRHMNRIAARKLFGAGLQSTFHIYANMPYSKPENAQGLASSAGISRELAELIQREIWEKSRVDKRWFGRYQRWARKNLSK